MEVYKRETHEILQRFLDRRIGHAECIAALDAAVAALIPTLTPNEIVPLRTLVEANYKAVAEEIGRRRSRKSPARDASAKTFIG